MKSFVVHGRTNPENVLTMTRTKPRTRRQRRFQMRSRASLQAADQRIFFFVYRFRHGTP
jgi:hypothetical protein